MSKKDMSFDTKTIHAGEPIPRYAGAVTLPIFQSSTFEYGGQDNYSAMRYIRLNNTPNHIALHEKLAALEGSEAALVTSSGMSAITASLLTFLKSGDHLLCHKALYGGTAGFVIHELPKYGIDVDFIDATQPNEWTSKLKSNTKVIYVETITNPLMTIPELDQVVVFANENNLISMIDNTFATPILYSPIMNGFDISLHSATKYLNGHSDIVGGAVIGREDHIYEIKSKLNHLGGSMDPNTCFLLHRGIKTLSLRFAKQCANAMEIAQYLDAHSNVAKVIYPGLPSSPDHDRARRFLGGFGAMLSFELVGDVAFADAFIKRLKYPVNAASLGGVESLITRPVQTSHSSMCKEERAFAGITDTLVRYSAGIESANDLIADLKQALEG